MLFLNQVIVLSISQDLTTLKYQQQSWRRLILNLVTNSPKPGRTSVRLCSPAKTAGMVSPPLIPHCPVQHFEGRPGIGQNRTLSWILTSPFESDPTLSMPALWAQVLDGTESFSSIARRLLDDLPVIANLTTQGTAF